MADRPFVDKTTKPDLESLSKVMGDVFQYYEKLNELTTNFKHTWNYSKGSGWLEKVENKKKALFYLIPLNDSFKISMAIRENEREFIVNDNSLSVYKKIVNEAKKYSEGYNIQFDVANNDEFDIAKQFIEIIIKLR